MCSSPSRISHFTHGEMALAFTTVTDHLYDEEPEAKRQDGGLLFFANYKNTDNSAPIISHIHPNPRLDEQEDRMCEITILKGATVSSDLRARINSEFQIDKMTRPEISSSDHEDKAYEDVFTELPMSGVVLESQHKMYISQRKQLNYGCIISTDNFSIFCDKDSSKKKLKEKHLQVR